MTNAVTVLGSGSQPAWLTTMPDEVKAPLVQALSALKPEEQKFLAHGFSFVTADMMAVCTTAEEALDILKAAAEGAATDDQANYIPAIYKIEHKTQRFQDDAGDSIKGSFRAVILHFQPTRGFFIEGRKLPLCSAVGNLLNGTAQKDASEAWQSYKLYTGIPLDWAGATHDCANCPFNEFGSNPKTGAGKACTEKYRLFLALTDAEGLLTGEGVMLNVPTTSMKNWDTYVSALRRHKDEKGHLQPLTTLQVVTEFTLEKAQGQGQDYAKVLPKTYRPLTAEEFKAVYGIRQQIVKVAEKLGVEVGETYGEEGGPTEPAGTDQGPEFKQSEQGW